MVVNIIQGSKKNKSCNKSRIHFQGLRILTSGRLGPFWKFEKGFGLRVHSRRFYYLFLLHRLGVKLVNDRLIRWLYKRYNRVRASSSLGRVARRHARATRWRRRECEGWRKKGEFSFFFAPRRSRVLSRLASLTTRNGEYPRRLAVQGMWIHTGGSDVNRLRLRIKGQHVCRIIPYQS